MQRALYKLVCSKSASCFLTTRLRARYRSDSGTKEAAASESTTSLAQAYVWVRFRTVRRYTIGRAVRARVRPDLASLTNSGERELRRAKRLGEHALPPPASP